MRVLVAEDDPVSSLVVTTVLRQQGHDVAVAADGAEAWALVEHGNVDVIISDWVMPGLDGLELCRRVRTLDRYVYFIMLSRRDRQNDVLEALEAGVDDHLAKPLDPLTLRMRMVVAARVTGLHRQLSAHRAEQIQLNVELAHSARTDPLTGLGNRLRLAEDIGDLDAGMERYGRRVSAALFDVDHFKAYNDAFGHIAGDNVLRQVAATIAAQLRSGDRAYRYGGEEFLVILPEQVPATASQAADRIRMAIEALAIPHRPELGLITVSAGVAEPPTSRRSTEAAIHAADGCLYVAKAAGRNRVSSVLGLELMEPLSNPDGG